MSKPRSYFDHFNDDHRHTWDPTSNNGENWLVSNDNKPTFCSSDHKLSLLSWVSFCEMCHEMKLQLHITHITSYNSGFTACIIPKQLPPLYKYGLKSFHCHESILTWPGVRNWECCSNWIYYLFHSMLYSSQKNEDLVKFVHNSFYWWQ